MNEKPSFLDLNNSSTIVPPMKNKVGDSYAETRAEIEARNRANAEALRQAEIQRLAEARAAEIIAAQKPEKHTGLTVLAVLMSLLAVAGVGATAALYFLYAEDEAIIQEIQASTTTEAADKTD